MTWMTCSAYSITLSCSWFKSEQGAGGGRGLGDRCDTPSAIHGRWHLRASCPPSLAQTPAATYAFDPPSSVRKDHLLSSALELVSRIFFTSQPLSNRRPFS